MPRFVLVLRNGWWRLSAVRDERVTPLGAYRSRGQAMEKVAQLQIAYMFPGWLLEERELSPIERAVGYMGWRLVEADGPGVQMFAAPSHALAFLRERQLAEEVRAELVRSRTVGDCS